jgi:hypothetical protein
MAACPTEPKLADWLKLLCLHSRLRVDVVAGDHVIVPEVVAVPATKPIPVTVTPAGAAATVAAITGARTRAKIFTVTGSETITRAATCGT